MSKVLAINRYGFENLSREIGRGKFKAVSSRRIFSATCRIARKDDKPSKSGSVKIGFTGACFILASAVVLCGAVYLYQVNTLATKGYEASDVERQIADLKKTNEQSKIKMVELQSMYNIEKFTQDLNLISSNNVSFLEINGPMAMK
jgi:hypothetical protein